MSKKFGLKLTAGLLSAALALTAFSACGGEEEPAAETTTAPVTEAAAGPANPLTGEEIRA